MHVDKEPITGVMVLFIKSKPEAGLGPEVPDLVRTKCNIPFIGEARESFIEKKKKEKYCNESLWCKCSQFVIKVLGIEMGCKGSL